MSWLIKKIPEAGVIWQRNGGVCAVMCCHLSVYHIYIPSVRCTLCEEMYPLWGDVPSGKRCTLCEEMYPLGRDVPGAHFTDTLSTVIQIQWKICLSIIPFQAFISPHSCAHAMTAQLSWHVLNCVAIRSLEFGWDQNEIAIAFQFWWIKWLGKQASGCGHGSLHVWCCKWASCYTLEIMQYPPGSFFNMKTIFPGIGIPIIKLRWSHNFLISIIGFFILETGIFILKWIQLNYLPWC